MTMAKITNPMTIPKTTQSETTLPVGEGEGVESGKQNQQHEHIKV